MGVRLAMESMVSLIAGEVTWASLSECASSTSLLASIAQPSMPAKDYRHAKHANWWLWIPTLLYSPKFRRRLPLLYPISVMTLAPKIQHTAEE